MVNLKLNQTERSNWKIKIYTYTGYPSSLNDCTIDGIERMENEAIEEEAWDSGSTKKREII